MLMDTSSNSSKKDVRKMGILCVLFVMVLGAFVLSWIRSGSKGQTSKIPVKGPSAPGGVERSLPEIGVTVASDEPEKGGADVTEPAGIPVPPRKNVKIPTPSMKIVDRTMSIEEGYLYELLTAAKDISEAELSSQAVKAPFKDFFDDPAEWRGKVLRLEGRIKRMAPRRPEQLPPGIGTVYEAQVLGHKRYWYYLFIVDKPRCGEDDLVTFDGIFMKVHGYENRKKTMTLAPLFVIKNFNKLELESPSVFRTVGWGVLAVVVLVAIILILVVRGQNRVSNDISRTAEDKRLLRAREWARSKKETSPEQEPAEEAAGDQS